MQNNTFSTLFVGHNRINLSAVDSTNDFLKRMVSNSEPLPEGTVIMADNQYAGRGQQQNTWSAEPGKNLTFSIYLSPKFLPLDKQFFLNMAVSNGLYNALSSLKGIFPKNKWPNDVYIENRKLGGVLIENIVAGSTIKATIVGIGINVNQRNFSTELTEKATSVYQFLQHDVNLIKLLDELCSQIEQQYLILRAGNYTYLKNVYVSNLYRYRQPGLFRQNGETFEGMVVDVTDTGQLVLKVDNGLRYYNFKEIEFLTQNT